MTASARDTAEAPGTHVMRRVGLNACILSVG